MMLDWEKRLCIGIVTDDENLEAAQEIAYGIEEYGAFYQLVIQSKGTNYIDVAKEYSSCNVSGIAIHIDSDIISIFTNKIKGAKPLFSYDQRRIKSIDEEIQNRKLRQIGSNAVCILSKRSFKEI